MKKEGVSQLIEFTDLSEGEQQLLTVLGLLLITSKDDSLYLLDEPDTHLNPNWQRDFVEVLRDFNLNKDNSHIFVATHSPFLVQSIEGGDMILFRREGDKVIIDQNDYFIEGWRIDHVLASEIFDLTSTRAPKYDNFFRLRNSIIQKGEITENDKRELVSLLEGATHFPNGETIYDIETHVFLSSVAKEKGMQYDKD